MKKYDVIIVGGGASGCSLAINLKMRKENLKILLLEQNDKILKKVLKTGNGKCNISNFDISSSHYHNYNFFADHVKEFDVKEYFKAIGLLIKKDEQGRFYPSSEVSNNVVDVMRYEIERLKVDVLVNSSVTKIEKIESFDLKNSGYNVLVNGEDLYFSNVLVMATGSCAQAKTNGYDLLRHLNHSVTELRPGLVPIKVVENVKPLKGIRVKVLAKVNDFNRRGEILFKEDGISGILSLELSRFVKSGDLIYLDLLPDVSINELDDFINKNSNKPLFELLNGLLPKMLSQMIEKDLSRDSLINKIKNFKVTVKSLCDFNNAQIVCGGINVNEVNNNFESKINKNLYIVGELLDVDGDCGGYNLHFAWLGAYVASIDILSKL